MSTKVEGEVKNVQKSVHMVSEWRPIFLSAVLHVKLPFLFYLKMTLSTTILPHFKCHTFLMDLHIPTRWITNETICKVGSFIPDTCTTSCYHNNTQVANFWLSEKTHRTEGLSRIFCNKNIQTKVRRIWLLPYQKTIS